MYQQSVIAKDVDTHTSTGVIAASKLTIPSGVSAKLSEAGTVKTTGTAPQLALELVRQGVTYTLWTSTSDLLIGHHDMPLLPGDVLQFDVIAVGAASVCTTFLAAQEMAG